MVVICLVGEILVNLFYSTCVSDRMLVPLACWFLTQAGSSRRPPVTLPIYRPVSSCDQKIW